MRRIFTIILMLLVFTGNAQTFKGYGIVVPDDPGTDFYGNKKWMGTDIGAIEFQPSQVFYNAMITEAVLKDNCPTGYKPVPLNVAIKERIFYSINSQYQADSLARRILDSLKQDYANTNGVCEPIIAPPPPTTYYNTETAILVSRDNCGPGYTTEPVVYTVAAGKWTSMISQYDADRLAMEDLNLNKQAYANINGVCTAIPQITYYSELMSVSVSRDNCGSGYSTQPVTYAVSSGRYSSVISQADADRQAFEDLNLNKQAYANLYGVCTLIPITNYYNIQQSGSAIKNDCPKGFKGSIVVYVVIAGKYTSTISQADANQKAINDVNTNKQAYANINGTCKKPGKR